MHAVIFVHHLNFTGQLQKGFSKFISNSDTLFFSISLHIVKGLETGRFNV